MKTKALLTVMLLSMHGACRGDSEINVAMMRSTFKLSGTHGGYGTGFIFTMPSTKHAGSSFKVIVTADHTFQSISDDSANIILHEQDSTGKWVRSARELPIRANKKELWLKHHMVDAAAIALPNKIGEEVPSLLGREDIITEKQMSDWNIHPGDAVVCLGFPLAVETGGVGFPVLRNAVVASFPLFPVRDHPTFSISASGFPGCSGGPVYLAQMDDSLPSGKPKISVRRGILGLVVQDTRSTIDTNIVLGLSSAVPGQFILELLDSVPEP